jgi:hypothetical protein
MRSPRRDGFRVSSFDQFQLCQAFPGFEYFGKWNEDFELHDGVTPEISWAGDCDEIRSRVEQLGVEKRVQSRLLQARRHELRLDIVGAAEDSCHTLLNFVLREMRIAKEDLVGVSAALLAERLRADDTHAFGLDGRMD